MLTLNLHIFFLLFPLIFLLFREKGLLVVSAALIFACIELYLWARREQRYNTLNWCHPVPIFVLGYCIVFYQLPFCYLAGFDLSYYSRYVLFESENISYCVLLATAGLAAFFIGEQVFFLKTIKSIPLWRNHAIKYLNIRSYFERIKLVTRILLVLIIILFYLFLQGFESLDAFFGFAYGDPTANTSSLSQYCQLAYTILLYLAILLQILRLMIIQPDSIRSYVRSWDIWVLVVLAITLVPFLMSGDRGTYLQPLALIAAPYFILVKPLKFKQAAVIVVGMAFLMALVGDIRGNTNFTLKEVFQSRIEQLSNPAQWPTMELANSFGTFNIATDYFPETYSYNYGIGTLNRMVTLVPFLSRMSGLEQLNRQNNYVYSSSLFFTDILTRGTFSSGSGTSSLADIYMDFSPWGIPVVLFFWGFIMSWVSIGAVRSFSPFFVFLYAYYSYFSIYVNRSSFFFGWNIFIWVLLLFSLINRLYLNKSSRQVIV
jgi:oligosaccharide repeat unit polymerase